MCVWGGKPTETFDRLFYVVPTGVGGRYLPLVERFADLPREFGCAPADFHGDHG